MLRLEKLLEERKKVEAFTISEARKSISQSSSPTGTAARGSTDPKRAASADRGDSCKRIPCQGRLSLPVGGGFGEVESTCEEGVGRRVGTEAVDAEGEEDRDREAERKRVREGEEEVGEDENGDGYGEEFGGLFAARQRDRNTMAAYGDCVGGSRETDRIEEDEGSENDNGSEGNGVGGQVGSGGVVGRRRRRAVSDVEGSGRKRHKQDEAGGGEHARGREQECGPLDLAASPVLKYSAREGRGENDGRGVQRDWLVERRDQEDAGGSSRHEGNTHLGLADEEGKMRASEEDRSLLLTAAGLSLCLGDSTGKRFGGGGDGVGAADVSTAICVGISAGGETMGCGRDGIGDAAAMGTAGCAVAASDATTFHAKAVSGITEKGGEVAAKSRMGVSGGSTCGVGEVQLDVGRIWSRGAREGQGEGHNEGAALLDGSRGVKESGRVEQQGDDAPCAGGEAAAAAGFSGAGAGASGAAGGGGAGDGAADSGLGRIGEVGSGSGLGWQQRMVNRVLVSTSNGRADRANREGDLSQRSKSREATERKNIWLSVAREGTFGGGGSAANSHGKERAVRASSENRRLRDSRGVAEAGTSGAGLSEAAHSDGRSHERERAQQVLAESQTARRVESSGGGELKDGRRSRSGKSSGRSEEQQSEMGTSCESGRERGSEEDGGSRGEGGGGEARGRGGERGSGKERGSEGDKGSGGEKESGNSGGGARGAAAARKHRRCWSPDIHQRFVKALESLGGCHVATPKQINALMKVDGLTNDEIKSHLQVRMLAGEDAGSHAQPRNLAPPNAPPASAAVSASAAAAGPSAQLLVLGGILVPSMQSGAARVAAFPADGISVQGISSILASSTPHSFIPSPHGAFVRPVPRAALPPVCTVEGEVGQNGRSSS
ncbi:unnamed protein product [Closterium sp. NIES-64]|nr:unnamed protein product [Closterium sp. NIES-64]